MLQVKSNDVKCKCNQLRIFNRTGKDAVKEKKLPVKCPIIYELQFLKTFYEMYVKPQRFKLSLHFRMLLFLQINISALWRLLEALT